MTKPSGRTWTREERQEQTTAARREWRFQAAMVRVRKIASGTPSLTEAQRRQLADELLQPNAAGT
jgi:hypothetical protein